MLIDGKGHIRKILRVVKDHDWHNNPVDRQSIGGEERYIEMIQEVYDHSPPTMKEIRIHLLL
jgi:hypothetical protein